FRVRDGSGRFPAAIDRRNFILFLGAHCVLWVVCFWWWGVKTGVWVFVDMGVVASVCKFSAG
ncbi:hypothetical protein, partial [Mycolicibacterium celeriflavum]|uniref:hypothetical protein n=1 Tax=Mycolicibacterium celeriflavum TaxID=1249101 RepID=UPI001A99E5ED